MKVNVDERLPDGVRYSFAKRDAERAPEPLRRLLAIPGVSGVFQTADFIAVDREPKADWQAILAAVREVLGEAEPAERPGQGSPGGSAAAPVSGTAADAPGQAQADKAGADGAFGEAQVFVQKFRGIPLQIRVKTDEREERVGMPQRFIDAAMKAQYGSPNLIAERKLEEYGVRYGELAEIAEQVLAELEAAYDEERLQRLTEAALSQQSEPEAGRALDEDELARALDDPDWRVRYAALEKLKPELRHLPLIVRALDDEKFSIRRLATVYLGDIGEPEVLPYLYRMLKDPNAAVRRTAGDCLSDIGDPDAIGPMCEALKDPSKIVRWRAARFLYEVGDEQALPALRAAKDDPEFEIRMQIEYAIARIEGGEAASGSVWQQMTQLRRNS